MKNEFDIKEFIRYRKKEVKTVLCMIFSVGIIFMIMGDSFTSKKNENTDTIKNISEEETYDDMEKKLEELLGCVKGAGKVKVMITYSEGARKVAAQNTKKEESISQDEQTLVEENTYFVLDGGSEDGALVLTEYSPVVSGVVIVAQGGDDVNVKSALSKAAQALLNVPAHKVEVLKMEG
jgi:stage III sporulation protein AG